MLIIWEVGPDPLLGSGESLCAQMTVPALLPSLLAGEPLPPEGPRKPCFLLCLLFLLLPFCSPSLSTSGLFFCCLSFVFSWCSSNPGHPCSSDLLCLLIPPQRLLPTLRKLVANWKNRKQVLQPIQFHR